MKVKQTILALSSLVVAILGIAMSPTSTYAATCGGVQTSIISCDQQGPCSVDPTEGIDPGQDKAKKAQYRQDYGHDYGSGLDPYEGANPGDNPDRIKAYHDKYGHDYGKCKTGSLSNSVTSSGIFGILKMALRLMTAGVGVLAIAGVVYAAILYTTAADRPEQIKKAKEMILNVVIGIIAFGLMFSFLNFLIPGGIFT